MKIAIAGASGFIGAELVKYLSAHHSIIALKRTLTNAAGQNTEERRFDLTDENTFNAFDDAEVLVHCAFIKADKKNKHALQTNIDATLKLAAICKQKNIHFVFLSSMSAHGDALSDYGKHKFNLEQKLDNTTACILKLGLVMGSSGGLYNTIQQTIAKSSVIPLISGGQQPIQVIHISDLAKLIEKIVQQKITGTYCIGSAKVYTLKYMYEAIAASRGKKIKFASLPFGFMRFSLSIAEGVGLTLPVTTENLLGLKQLKAFDTQADLNALKITLLSLEEAVTIS